MPSPKSTIGNLTGFLRFCAPIIEVLIKLGGSARSAQVKDLVTDLADIPDAERTETLKNGVSRIGNQIDWARFCLAKTGYLDSSKRGVWALTEKGRAAIISAEVVREIVREVNESSGGGEAVGNSGSPMLVRNEDVPVAQQTDHRASLLNVVKALPPRGFEELSRYLLLESGFEEVTVTGRVGDGGIDGQGVLRVSKLVWMKVLFQCKRYAEAVGPSVVRDFRGSLAGRAEKGIILTTGYFTSSAEQKHAVMVLFQSNLSMANDSSNCSKRWKSG